MYEIHPDLDKKLAKLAKKDPSQFEQVMQKIEQVIQNPSSHYKNLRRPLQKYKRVHVYKSFVLLFSVSEQNILFREYEHHDVIYQLKL